MGEGERQDGTAPVSGSEPAPGTLSALLKDLARQPEAADVLASLAPGSGEKVGRFEVVREIGRGGFGVVLEARDPVVGRRVAVKLVRPGRSAERRGAPNFEEAEAVGRLSHPNVVQLHEAGSSDFGPYLVFELLRGEPLSKRLERGPLSPAEAARMALEVAKGLAAAHGSAVVHRDLKPSNVFLCEDGQVKVLDFGLALVLGKRRQIEGGTPGWMAPEQRIGAPEDERTDVWALGAILFRALAGRDPAKAQLEIPEVPELERLLERMLAPDPVKRPRDAKVVVEALEPIVRGLEAATQPVAVRVRRRVPRAVRYAVPVVLAVALLVTGALRLRDRIPSLAGDDGPILTAVADIQNHTGDVELDALSGLLMTALEQSKVLKVLSRGRMFQVLRKMGQESVERFDEPLAREISERVGARMLLAWSVQKFGETYSIELKGLDTRKDEYLFALEERVDGKARLLEGLDRLSARAREKLREATNGVSRGPTLAANAATTTNLEAYRHYFHAVDLQSQVRMFEALEEARLALKADPEFAMAALFIANLGAGPGYYVSPDEYRSAVATAARNADRAPDYERLLIKAFTAETDRESVSFLDEAIEKYPDRVMAYSLKGDLFFNCRFFDEALPLYERAAQLDPTFAQHASLLQTTYFALGRIAEGVAVARRAFSADPTGANRLFVYEGLLYEGRFEEALEEARRLKAQGALEGILVEALMSTGRLDEAEAEARSLPDRPTFTREVALIAVLERQGRFREVLVDEKLRALRGDEWAVYVRGDLGGVRARAPTVDARSGENQFVRSLKYVCWLSDLGAHDDAERLFAAVNARWPQEGCRNREEWMACRPSTVARVGAVLKFRRGQRDEALAQYRAIQGDRWDGWPLFYLGVLESEAGNDREAIEVLRRFDLTYLTIDHEVRVPRSTLLQARSLERLGRRDEARAAIEKLLGWWKKADPDLPMLAEAKALAKRVNARVP